MKLASFTQAERDEPRVGVVVGGELVALAVADPSLPTTIEGLLRAGSPALDAARDAASRSRKRLSIDDVKLCAPIPVPRKFLGIGFNYKSHLEEAIAKGVPTPDLTYQPWFNKQTSCITGPYDPVHRPRVSEQLDFECELAVVIGRSCRHVAAKDAHEVIAGYMVTNDLSVRDWQRRTPTATLGKSFDTHGPTGPWLTTADEVPDPHALGIRTLVDGVVRQDGNTAEMIFRIAEQIEYLTTVMTLEPGDILATGTPRGVALGEPVPNWLKAGQVVRVEIETLGHIENPVINEPMRAS